MIPSLVLIVSLKLKFCNTEGHSISERQDKSEDAQSMLLIENALGFKQVSQ